MPQPMSANTAAPQPRAEYGGTGYATAAAPSYGGPSGGGFTGGPRPTGPPPGAITPGQGDYSGVGPGDPAGYLSSPYSAGYPFSSLQDLSRYLIRGGGQQGVFQPDYLRRYLRDKAMRNAASQRNRGRLAGTLAGFDPSQQREAILSSDIAASSDLTDQLGEADLASGSEYMNFIRSLLTGERGGESSFFNERALMELQDRMQGSGLEEFLGSAAGGALSTIVPGLFPKGGRSGGGGGGGGGSGYIGPGGQGYLT